MSELKSRATTGRLLAALLSGSLVLAFWGCGGSNSVNLTPPGGGDAGEDATGPGEDGSMGHDGSGGQDGSGSHDATGGQDATGGGDSGSTGSDAGGGDTGTGGQDSGSSGTDSGSGGVDGGHDACVPKTCAQQGFDCGMALDGCGNIIDCGASCPTGQTCGYMTPNVCGGVTCVPKSCAQQGFNCGSATDGCNNVIQCGSCPPSQTCGGGGANVCGTGVTCTGLCQQQTTCTGMATTSITGKVLAPNGTDPLYDVLVYVPNGGAAPTYGVQAFTPGVTCGACGADVTGSPLVWTFTAVDGTFTINNMPVGANIPLVIQTGRWRRQVTIPNVASCVSTAVANSLTTMPACHTGNASCPAGEPTGDIPLMGFVTGSVDSLECVLRKIGIADSEFTNPGGTGRVSFYEGNGDGLGSAGVAGGAIINASTPTENSLWGTQAAINAYDMVYFACEGAPYTEAAGSQQIVVDYTNAGGRLFTTHYGYEWLYDDAPFSGTATWDVDQIPNFAADPETADINQTFPEGLALAQWLKLLYPTSTQGQITLNTLRHDFDAVTAPSLEWLSITDANYTTPIPMHYTFNTPVGSQPANQCGKVLYNDYHVEDSESNPVPTTGQLFPAECNTNAMTQQEKMLEFDIFDLGACVTPPPACVPKTCAEIGASCGFAGDGCGNIIMPSCGTCNSNQSCVNGACTTQTTCVPKTCAELGLNCGNASDGCSSVINCGTCSPPLTCGGGGQSNVCGGQF
jgi:hypothetical protein